MNEKPAERSIREVRDHLADVINEAIRGRITYITNHGRRVAAVVPLTAPAAGERQPVVVREPTDPGVTG